MVKCEYHHNPAALQAVCAQSHDCDGQTPLFARASWFEMLHRHCLPDNIPAVVTAIGDNPRQWVHLYLIDQDRGRLRSLTNYYSFSFAPLFSPGLDRSSRLALLTELARFVRRKTHHISLSPVPEEDENARLICQAFRNAGWIVMRRMADVNHVLDVGGRTFEAYWQARPGKLRSTVKRKTKANAVRCMVLGDYSEAAWADYQKVYEQSWKSNEGYPQFLQELAMREAGSGRLRVGLAYMDNAPVAAQLWTLDGNTAYIHKLAYAEHAVKASPGTLLSAAMFRHVIDIDKVGLIDFGNGDDGYKRDWMDAQRSRWQLDMFDPKALRNWPLIGRKALSHLVARYRKA